MCVDDYEFRHFSSKMAKVCRKFVIVNEQEFARTYLVNISQFQEYGDVGLCKILLYLSKKGLDIQNRKFYLPKFRAIILPYTYCRIKFEALDQKQLILRSYPMQKDSNAIFNQNKGEQTKVPQDDDENYYCRFEQLDDIEQISQVIEDIRHFSSEEPTLEEKIIDESEEVSWFSRNEEPSRRTKESERGIFQVIRAVKIWRKLYQSKKCNLTKAAKVVGMSKKSLDDYFLVLRIGELLKFKFGQNLDRKMGDLRNYIRASGQKVRGKLGKNVDCFKLIGELDLDKIMQEGLI